MGVRCVDVSTTKQGLKCGRLEPVINCFLSFLNANFFFLPWLLASVCRVMDMDRVESAALINDDVLGKSREHSLTGIKQNL